MTISGMPSTRSGRQSTRRTSASDHGARWHPHDFLGGRAELADRLKRIVPAGQAVDRAAGRTLQKRQHKLHRPIGLCRFRRVGNQQPEAARPLARDSRDVVQQPRCRCCAIRDDQNSRTGAAATAPSSRGRHAAASGPSRRRGNQSRPVVAIACLRSCHRPPVHRSTASGAATNSRAWRGLLAAASAPRPKGPDKLTNLCSSAASKGLGVASRGAGNGLEAAARMRRPLRLPPTCLPG